MHKGITQPSYRARPAYHATLLGGMALMITAILAIADLTTRDTIALRLEEDLIETLAEVIPPAIHDNKLLDDTVTLNVSGSLFGGKELIVYRALYDSKVVAAAYEVIGKGYAGDIRVLLGIDRDGKLLGVRVVSHLETPGLGDKIEVKKSSWITDFTGLSLDNPGMTLWKVKKDGGHFDQFSGATITPRAVVTATREGLIFFNEHKTAILAANSQPLSDSTATGATP